MSEVDWANFQVVIGSPYITKAEARRRFEENRRQRDVEQLIDSASVWIAEALNAWSDDDYMKVGLLAPLAVEHLGKAVLWKKNPVLVVPLTSNAEASLLNLATAPNLADPKLRTVGLAELWTRLETVIGPISVARNRRNRMVEIRNGAMHVAVPTTSRHVLIDALTLCNQFLEWLKHDPEWFYGDHQANVKHLVAEGHSEVQHRVAAKLARARRNLTQLENRLSEAVFQETTERLEDDAIYDLAVEAVWAVDRDCPECGRRGRLAGPIGLDTTIYAGDPDGDHASGWKVTMSPDRFGCNVCRLMLDNVQELSAAGLPSWLTIDPDDLGPDFDPDHEAERRYGINH
ncbi:hypothetical protein [Nocardia xishanensis]|uniref:Restriction endonuclease n=1 Tax=Nocardia xishanensis TaxID=238964 RepID=A0ABW7XCW7_9NOCA